MRVQIGRLSSILTLRRFLTIASLGLAAIVVLIGLLLANQTVQNDAANQAVTRSSIVRMRLQHMLSLLQDAETGQRGYLLTDQERFLAPYQNAVQALNPDMRRLAIALEPFANQRDAFIALRNAVDDKMAELATTIRLHQTGQQARAIAIVSSGRGLAQMENMRKIMRTMQARQMLALKEGQTRRNAGYARTQWFVGSLLASLAIFMAFSAVIAIFNFRARGKIITEVSLLTKHLGTEKERLLQTVQELNAAKKDADDANRAKSDFLAKMSHELRTPLNAILGFSEIIRDELFGPVGLHQYVDYANDVHTSGQHLLELIDDILDLSKIDAGKVELHEEKVDLAQSIAESLTLVRERATKQNVAVQFEDRNFAPTVWADRRLLKQIMLNLLSNAIKFTPQGGKVTVNLLSDAEGVGFSVRDTGIGMSAADIEKAMLPYGQVDSKVARKHKGTGLGLPISRSLAQLHGGELAIASKPDQGTCIRLLLPLSRVVDAAAARQAS